jgi:hypothetical protein
MRPNLYVLGVTLLALTFGGCKGGKYSTGLGVDDDTATPQDGYISMAPKSANGGAASQMPAFYDDQLFVINSIEINPSEVVLAHNSSVNTIYATNDLDDEQDFFPVLDAIQGDGFNPLWHQVLIAFNPGFTPRQLTSDVEVLAAAAGDHPEITLNPTDEVYRCSVVGRK